MPKIFISTFLGKRVDPMRAWIIATAAVFTGIISSSPLLGGCLIWCSPANPAKPLKRSFWLFAEIVANASFCYGSERAKNIGALP